MLRVVLRRCGLVLVHVASEAQVVVQFWGQPAPDISAFLMEHRLARPQIQVAFVNRKNEQIVLQPGTAFMCSKLAKAKFPWELFESKYERRHVEEPDDWQVAPHTWGTLGWEKASSERMIPWAVLKSIWRHDQAPACQECGTPFVVVRLSWVLAIMFSGIRKVVRGCFWCHTEVGEWVEKDFWGWLVKNLGPDLLPSHQYATRKLDLRGGFSSRPDHGC